MAIRRICQYATFNDIQSSVAVARSRGMRYFFFIQSFSQIEQVYGKETASIIIDNCALCYLKTNSVECAEVIAKKVRKIYDNN